MENNQKTCGACGQALPITKLKGYARTKAWRHANPEKAKEQRARWWKKRRAGSKQTSFKFVESI